MACENLISIASPLPQTAPPEQVQDTSSPLDTEMICPLTSYDNGSIISGSSDLEGEMPGFQEGRVGSGSNRGGPQGRSATVSGGQYRPEIGFTANGYNGNPVGEPNNFRQYDPHSPLMGNTYGSPSRPRGSSMGVVGERPIPLSLVSPGPVWPTENQLSVAFAYGIRRNDGTYTRLVRADEIQDYLARGMPPNQGPEGLIILPQPHQIEPARRQGNEMISHEVYILFTGHLNFCLHITDHSNPPDQQLSTPSPWSVATVRYYAGWFSPLSSGKRFKFCRHKLIRSLPSRLN